MKKLILLSAMAFIATLQGLHAQAVLTFEKTTVELGTFTADQPQKCTFTFTNTGNKPLVIQQAFSTCGCTVPEYPKDPVQPGQKGSVSVTYNGKGKAPGTFSKPITIRSNATNSLVRIYIKGEMKETPKK